MHVRQVHQESKTLFKTTQYIERQNNKQAQPGMVALPRNHPGYGQICPAAHPSCVSQALAVLWLLTTITVARAVLQKQVFTSPYLPLHLGPPVTSLNSQSTPIVHHHIHRKHI